MAIVVKNPAAKAGDVRDTGSIPGSGKSSGGGLVNPLQNSCLKNPIDRGAWRATVHGGHKESVMTEEQTLQKYQLEPSHHQTSMVNSRY